MIDIKDKITLGVIAGITANIFKNIIEIGFYLLNIKHHLMYHLAASVYIPKENINSPISLLIGIIVDYTMAATLGVAIIYILYYTGLKANLLKGLFSGLLMFILIYGVITQSGITRINPEDEITHLAFLIGHITIGVLIPIIAIKFGKSLLIHD